MKSFCGSPLNLFILSIKEMVTVWYSEVRLQDLITLIIRNRKNSRNAAPIAPMI